jgi:hypothetical protein
MHIFLIIYFISFIITKLWLKIFYSKQGKGHSDWCFNKNIDEDILIFSLCPVLNTILAIIGIFVSPYKK